MANKRLNISFNLTENGIPQNILINGDSKSRKNDGNWNDLLVFVHKDDRDTFRTKILEIYAGKIVSPIKIKLGEKQQNALAVANFSLREQQIFINFEILDENDLDSSDYPAICYEPCISQRKTFIENTRKLLNSSLTSHFLLTVMKISRYHVLQEFYGKKKTDSIINQILSFLNEYFFGVGTFSYTGYGTFAFSCPAKNFNIKDFDSKLIECFNHNFEINILFTYGIYRIYDKEMEIASMYNKAILALDEIYANSDSNYYYYSEKLKQKNLMEHELITGMENGLKNNEFIFFLQPIFSLSMENAFSAEALVRWNHPTLGLLSPVYFISLFEKTGLIYKLDKYIWEAVFKYQKDRNERKLPEIIISVNVSRKSLLHDDLPTVFENLATKYDVLPSTIGIEITETAYHNNPNQVLQIISKLKTLGFRILMDDFGTGYSSLNTLQELPIDFLKIDMQLTDKINISTKAANILTSVVRMAIWLNIPAIAEGVEKIEQKDFLKSIGCDKIQGYLFSKPLKIVDFEIWEKNITESKKNNKYLEKYQNENANKIDKIFMGDSLYSEMMNNTFCGIGFYELDDKKELNIIRVNNMYYQIFGYNTNSIKAHMNDVLKQTIEEDRPIFSDALKKAELTNETQMISIRRYSAEKKLLLLDLKINFLGKKGTSLIYSISFSDVSEKKIVENTIHNLLESLPCGLIQFNCQNHRDKKIININRSAIQLLNIDDKNRLNPSFEKDFIEKIDIEDRESVIKRLHQTCYEKKLSSLTFKITQENITKWILASFDFASWINNDTIVQMSLIDITKQKEAEALAQKGKIRLKELIHEIPEGIIQFEPIDNFPITACNSVFLKIIGLDNVIDTESFMDRSLLLLISDEEIKEKFENKVYSLIKSDKENKFSLSFPFHRLDDGNLIYIQAEFSATLADNKKIIQGVIHDVTAKHYMETARYNKYKLVTTILDYMTVAVGLFHYENETITLAFANNYFYKKNLYELGEISSSKQNVISLVHPDDLSPLLEKIKTCVKDGVAVDHEFRFIKKDKTTLWTKIHASKLSFYSKGDVYIATFTEIQNKI